jgi:ferritin-like metal-binding protein YciE
MANTTTKKSAKKNQDLGDLLVVKMQALYDVEQELVKALPAMAKNSTDPELKKGFEQHLEQTKGHVKRLERAFAILGVPAKKIKGEAIRGLVTDAKWVIQNVKGAQALDANLVAAGQYVEHYEMAG